MLMSSLCGYSEAYIIVSGSRTIDDARKHNAAKNSGERNQGVRLKNCASPFTKYISKINYMQTDDANDIDIVMLMYNLIEYSDNHSKSLWQYYKNEPNDT